MFKIKVDLKGIMDGVSKSIKVANTLNMLANVNSLIRLDRVSNKIIINYTDNKKNFILKLDASFDGDVTVDTLMLDLNVLSNTLQLCSGTSSIDTGDLVITVDTEKHLLHLQIEHFLSLKETAEDGTDIVKTVSVGKVNQSLNYFTGDNITGNSMLMHKYNQLLGIDFDSILVCDTLDFSVGVLKDIANRKSGDVGNLYFTSTYKVAFTASLASLSVIPYGVDSDFFYIINSDMANTILDTLGGSETIKLGAKRVNEKLVKLYFISNDNNLGIEYVMHSAIGTDLDMFKAYTESDYSNNIVVYKDVLDNVLSNLNKFLKATTMNLSTIELEDGSYSLVVTLKSSTDVKRFDIKVLNGVSSPWNIDVNIKLLNTLVGYCKEPKITLGLNNTTNGIKLAIYDTDKELDVTDLHTVGRYYTQVSGGK